MRMLLVAVTGVAVSGGLLLAVGGQEPAEPPTPAEVQMDEISYGVGFFLGEEIRDGLQRDGIEAKLALVIDGFADGLKGQVPDLAQEELEDILEAVHKELKTRMVKRLLAEDQEFKKQHDENLRRSRAFHEAFGKTEGVVTLDNGVQYKVVHSGDGPSPGLDDVAVVRGKLLLVDGTVVIETEGMEADVDGVVEGGTFVLQMMKVGDRWQVAVPPELGHGPGGRYPDIGPNETLIFDLELLGIK